ncbi:hypothetical protein HDV57DRAFT_443463 [Trichoderma longibrachiatum]
MHCCDTAMIGSLVILGCFVGTRTTCLISDTGEAETWQGAGAVRYVETKVAAWCLSFGFRHQHFFLPFQRHLPCSLHMLSESHSGEQALRKRHKRIIALYRASLGKQSRVPLRRQNWHTTSHPAAIGKRQ